MTASFPILYKYETISFKDWDTVPFLEKNVFFRNVANSVADKSNFFPKGVEDMDALVDWLDAAVDDTKWFITVNNEPAGVWFFQESDQGILINFYLLPSYKILDSFFSAFFCKLDSLTDNKIFIDLSTYPEHRVINFNQAGKKELISGDELNNKIDHPHVSTLLEELKTFYS